MSPAACSRSTAVASAWPTAGVAAPPWNGTNVGLYGKPGPPCEHCSTSPCHPSLSTVRGETVTHRRLLLTKRQRHCPLWSLRRILRVELHFAAVGGRHG